MQGIELTQIISDNVEEVQELLRDATFSGFENYPHFKVLRLRTLHLAEQALSFVSTTFLIKGTQVYVMETGTERFKKIPNGMPGMLKEIEAIYAENGRVVETYSTTLASLEDDLFSRSIPSYFLDMWFDLKKDLSQIQNYYYRNGSVYREFYKRSESLFGDLADDFKDIEEGIQFQTNGVTTLSQRLESLHSYYNSIKSDRLNKTLLMLTVISGIFLPLNLLVGFFGMNTEGMFFQGDPTGTEKVIVILLVVLVLSSVGLRIVKMVDHYFLRFVLGRYNFYKNITGRLNEIDDRLKGQ